MPDNRASYAITLTTEGGAQVRVTLNELTAAVERAAALTGSAYDKSATDFDNAEKRKQAAIDRTAAAEKRRMAATAQRISESLDPTAAPTRAFNSESERATKLLSEGLISQKVYDAYLLKLKTDLAQATGAMKEHGSVLGLNRAQYITAQSAVLRFGDSVVAGRNPLTALTLESHKLVEIMSLGDGGMAGALTKVGALFSPVVIGSIAAGAAFVAGSVAAFQYAEQFDTLSRAADGFGRTSQLTGARLLDTAAASAYAGRVSVAAAGQIETAILQQTRTSDAVLAQAIEITQRFADAMGTDVAKAADQLGKSLADPARAADDLTAKFGYLTQAQVEEIHQLMEQNRLTDAQSALLGDLDNSLDKTGEHVNGLTRAWRALSSAISNGWNDIGSAIDHAVGIYSDAEKIAEVQGKIFADQQLIAHHDSQLFYDDTAARKQLADDQAALAAMEKPGKDARANQLGSQARDIAGKYAIDPTVQPKLEQLKQELATLKDAQAAGQHVSADTLDALNHAIRTYMTPEQKRIAEQNARAMLRQAAPHSADRERAGQLLMDATTSGEVVTEAGARTLSQDRGLQALGHARGAGRSRSDPANDNALKLQAETAAELALADAYLHGSDAIMRAEAARKVAGESAKKVGDAEAETARQLALAVAEQIKATAQSTAKQVEENTVRTDVLAKIKAGTVDVKDMDKAIQDETQQRAFAVLKLNANADALKQLIPQIEAYNAAQAKRRDLDKAIADAAAQQANAKDFQNRKQELDDQIALVEAQNSGNTANIAAMQMAIELHKSGNDLTEEQLKQLDDLKTKLTDLTALQKQHADSIKALNDLGAQSLNELLSPDGIEHWGQTWHDVIRKILTDLEQMAILNPLENMLFGGNRATLGGAGGGGGLFGGLLGGLTSAGAGDGGFGMAGFGSVLGFASGTDSAPGGPAIVGENGPELINLPSGSSVMTAGETRAALSGNGGSNVIHFHMPINAQGAGPREIDALRVELRQFKRDMPAIAFRTVFDAQQRAVGQR